ncbi:MAG TPA: hypothetical protein VN806_08200, partial [Caulobacteraceae bacterium]|nr:hypothetical protein [Caulobacteraceae bacterium]
GARNVVTLDSGVYNDDHLVDYRPQLRFYTLAWGARGLRIGEEDPNGEAAPVPGKVLVTCDPNWSAAVAALGPPVVAIPGCSAVLGR